MFFQWPAQKPELQGNRRRDRRRQSADDIAMGGFLNLDGTYNETFQKLIENEPLPQPRNPFGRPTLPRNEANAPRYKKLGAQLRGNALIKKVVPRGQNDSLADIVGSDASGNDVRPPRGFSAIWDDDMETVIGHMNWQTGVAVPLGQKFPAEKEAAGKPDGVFTTVPVRKESMQDPAITPSVPVLEPSATRKDGPPTLLKKMSETLDDKTDRQSGDTAPEPIRTGRPDIPEISGDGRFAKRPEEDVPAWLERIGREQEILQSSSQAQRFGRGRDAFDALARSGGATVAKSDGFGVTFDFGGGAVLSGVDSTGGARLARKAADNPALRDALRLVAAGELDAKAIDARLKELDDATPNVRAGARRRILTPERRAERDRLTVLRDVAMARADGASAEEIGGMLIDGFAPDPAADIEAAQEMLLDILPGIGEIRSARDAVGDFDAMAAAVAAGDWETAAREGLFGLLDTAGAVPVFGKLAKPAKGILKRGLEGTATGKKLVAQNKLARFEKQFPKNAPTLDQKTILDGIDDAATRDTIRPLLNGAMGRASELEVIEQMRKAGFNVETDFIKRAVGKPGDDAARGRVYDATTPDGVKNLFKLFFRPAKSGKGTAIEVKSGGGTKDRSQRLNDEAVVEQGVETTKKRPFDIGDVRNLRVRLDQIDAEHLRAATSMRLDSAVERGKLDRQTADMILGRVMDYQSRSSTNNPIPLAAIAGSLRAVASIDDRSER